MEVLRSAIDGQRALCIGRIKIATAQEGRNQTEPKRRRFCPRLAAIRPPAKPHWRIVLGGSTPPWPCWPPWAISLEFCWFWLAIFVAMLAILARDLAILTVGTVALITMSLADFEDHLKHGASAFRCYACGDRAEQPTFLARVK